MLIRNAVGTSRFEAPKGYKSWFDYWLNHTNKSAVCASSGDDCCFNGTYDLVGAHVQKVDSQDKNWYIVPLCKSCNKKDKPFNVDDDMLVPVPSNM